jgi:hypothetical protein
MNSSFRLVVAMLAFGARGLGRRRAAGRAHRGVRATGSKRDARASNRL